MTFEEAMRRYAELYRQWQAGALAPAQLMAAVTQLRVQDARGGRWQVDPSSGGWLMWNGAAWVAGQPPQQAMAPAQPVRRPSAGRPEVVLDAAATAEQLLTAPDQMLAQVGQRGLSRLTPRWWDAASIFGGFAGGVLWLLYTGVRAEREGLDLFTPVIIALMPIIMVRCRGLIDGMLTPFQGIRERIPRVPLVGAGLVAPFVVAQLLYDKNLPLFGQMREYPYMQASVILGTIASYVILRTPERRPR